MDNYINTSGVKLYRWYQQGTVDSDDLLWLLEFYNHVSWRRSTVLATLQAAGRHYEQ